MVRILNSQLADTLGNLLSRCTGQNLNPRQEFPQLHIEEFRQLKQDENAAKLIESVDNLAGGLFLKKFYPFVCSLKISNIMKFAHLLLEV